MKIKEVCLKTGLTKKAIEYYIEKKLVEPEILENGYREFKQEDMEQLLEVALYRKTGLSVDEIKQVITDSNILTSIIDKKTLELNRKKEQIKILQKLQVGESIESIKDDIYQLDRKMTIIEKLLNMFPGYYGKLICMNFSRYLNEPISNHEQEKAFCEIVDFLDNAPRLEIPVNLQKQLNEYNEIYTEKDIQKTILEKEKNIKNYQEFLKTNKELLKTYYDYKQSEEYQSSLVAELSQVMKEFCQTSGYYDIFIPAMRRLSKQYNQYYLQLLEANDYLLKQYPELMEGKNVYTFNDNQ